MIYKEQPATQHLEIEVGPEKETTRVARISINYHPDLIPPEMVKAALDHCGFMLGRFLYDHMQVSEWRQN